eukprot:gene32258-40842_t
MRDLLSLLPLEARLQLAARQLGPDVATWGTWGDFGHFSYREEEAEEAARRERVRTLLRELQSQARQKSKLQELPALRGLQAQQPGHFEYSAHGDSQKAWAEEEGWFHEQAEGSWGMVNGCRNIEQ